MAISSVAVRAYACIPVGGLFVPQTGCKTKTGRLRGLVSQDSSKHANTLRETRPALTYAATGCPAGVRRKNKGVHVVST
jgi:hypothetical protein